MDFISRENADQYGKNLSAVSESYRKIKKMFNQRDLAAVNAEIKESYRIDIGNKQVFDLNNPFFSIQGFRETVFRQTKEGRYRESLPESAFSALLRAGINNYANGWYDLTDTVYEDIVMVVPSSHAVEPYAPVHRGGVPRRTPPNTPSPEVKVIAPMDIQILNEKYTSISAVPEELIKWDMTGQIQMRLQDMGPNMAQYEDAYAAGKFISPTGGTTFFDDTIPASTTKPSVETSSTWPWTTAFLGGGANILASYKRFNQQTLQDMDNLLFKQKDMNGNRLVVNPDTLFHGGAIRFVASELLNSVWYPGSGTLSVSQTTTDSKLGTNFGANVMKGLYRPVASRYLPERAYAIGMAHKGMVFQVASGLEVVQENPNAGSSFTNGEIRYKAKKFWGCDWIDPRFWGLCDDGTAGS